MSQDAMNLFVSDEQVDNLTKEVNKLNVKSSEKFYTDFYCKIVKSATKIITTGNPSSAVLILSKLCPLLISIQKEKEEKYLSIASCSRTITERELAGLQYLGGYILQNLHKNFQKLSTSKSEEVQNSMAVLKSLRNEEKPQNQKLVSALDRNGLWYVTRDFEEILLLAEKQFCYEVKNRKNLKILDQDYIVSKIMDISTVKMYLQQSLLTCDIQVSEQNSKDVLQTIIKLFVRVRSFNFAKDVVQKTKLKQLQERSSKKSLRKNLKESFEDYENMI